MIRARLGRNVSPAVAPAETSSGVFSSSAPMTPTLTPLTLNTTDGVTQSGASPVAVSTMFVARNGKFGPRLLREQPLDAVVELVVAVRRGVEAPCVLDVDRRHVLEQRRVRRRRADVVAAGEDQPGPGSAASSSSNIVARNGGAADGLVDAVDDRASSESSWPWKSLSPMIEIGL